MPCTHAGLYSYLPLSHNGPKGEGDQGGEGSLLVPLTYKHTCSMIDACLDPIPTLRRYPNNREAPQTLPRTQRLSPSKRPSRRPATQAGTFASGGERCLTREIEDAISSPHGSRDRFPAPRRWKVHLLYAAPPLVGAPAESVLPVLGRLCRPHCIAGEIVRPGVTGIRASEPLRGSAVVIIGGLRSRVTASSRMPSHTAVEH